MLNSEELKHIQLYYAQRQKITSYIGASTILILIFMGLYCVWLPFTNNYIMAILMLLVAPFYLYRKYKYLNAIKKDIQFPEKEQVLVFVQKKIRQTKTHGDEFYIVVNRQKHLIDERLFIYLEEGREYVLEQTKFAKIILSVQLPSTLPATKKA